jgi:very-short-patch-repair endonuclease
MGARTQQSPSGVWALVGRQQGVVSRPQLLRLGYTPRAIQHRIDTGRLFVLWRGVYAVGRPDLTQLGWWMAAVLSCGPGAALSDLSAASLLRISDPGIDLTAAAAVPRPESGSIHVTVPPTSYRRSAGIRIHRRVLAADDVSAEANIPVTTPIRTLVDLGAQLSPGALETAINEADRLDLVDPERLRSALDGYAGQPGVACLREVLDRRTFTLTRSQLERRFRPIARAVGLGKPLTQHWLHGYPVDFYWPELGLVVETDGLRYHRTPAQQARDRIRDQKHLAAGLAPLRFTHAQVYYEPGYVRSILAATVARLRRSQR